MAEIVVKLVNGELAGKTAQSIAKEVNALALAAKKAEVGTKAWVEANKKLEAAKDLQVDLKKQIEGTTDASDFLKKSWNSLPGAQFFNQIGDSFGFMKKGVGGLVSQFGMLKVAIASTGIGLLVLALGSLISYFTSTQAGIDKVTSVTRPLKAIFDALIGVVQNLGGKAFDYLAKAIDNPIQALKDLGQIIVDNVINRFKALALLGPAINKILKGDFAEGFKDLGNAVLQGVTGIEDVIGKVTEFAKATADFMDEAWQKGKRIDELQKSIERHEINQIKRNKELELVIKQQKDIVEDATRSWDERRAAAEKALQAQQLQLTDELSLIDKRIEKMKIEHSLNDTSREQEKELAELQAKRFEVQATMTEQSIEFKKKIQEFDKAQADQEAATIKNLEDLRLQAMKESAEKEIAQIELDTERKIEALTGSAEQITEQKVLLEEIEAQAIQAVRDRYAAEQAEKDQKAKDEQLARDTKIAEDQKRIAQEKADFERQMSEIEADLALDVYGTISDIAAARAKDEKAAKRIRKASAIAEIGISLQRELAANSAAAAANPLNGVTFGAAGAAQLIRANTASIIRAAIGAAKVLVFRRGGITPDPRGQVLRGPSHEGGGIDVNAEGNEIIMTRGVYYNPALRRAASAINVLGGGRSFESGGPTNPLFTRSRSPIPSGNAGQPSDLFDYEKLAAIMDARMDNKIYNIRVSNNLQDTERGLTTLQSLRAEADV